MQGVALAVPEAQDLVAVHGGAHGDQHLRVRPRRAGRGDGVDEVHTVPEVRRHDLPDGGERAGGGLGDVGTGGGRHGEGEGDRDGLLVVEEQRRQVGPGAQAVPARRPAHGLHPVAEVAEPVDVAAQGPRTDGQPGREFVPRPLAVHLQQGQQREHAGGRIGHVDDHAPESGHDLTAMPDILVP